MAYPAPKIKMVRDNVIRVFHPDVLDPFTYLTATVASSGTTLTVKNNSGFSNTDPQDLVLFEGLGHENAEIKRINGAVSAGTSLTVQALTFGHGIDTPICKILFDQVEISRASTAAGSKTVIDTVSINVTGEYTDFVVTGTTDNFYFARFKNSLSTTTYFGAYSAAVASTGFDPKNLGFIIRNAFEQTGENVGGIFPEEWIYDQIYLTELDVVKSKPYQRLSSLIEHDTNLGSLTEGQARIALPSDIEDNQTNKSIFGVRIENEENLNYVDRVRFEEIMRGVAHTTVASQISSSATSVTLTDTDDFEDSGTVLIASFSAAYTANNRSTNVLSGISASVFTSSVAADVDAWQYIGFGEPLRFTVNDGYIYFDIPPDENLEGRNVWIDYYKTPTRHDSDGDSVSVNDPELIQLGLEIRIKEKKSGNKLSPNDPLVLRYEQRKKNFIDNDQTGQKLRMTPDLGFGLR